MRACGLGLMALSLSWAGTAAADSKMPYLDGNTIMIARTTAYNHREADHIKFGALNALGTGLKVPGADVVKTNATGTIREFEPTVGSAAADWSRFPVGTRFEIVRTKQVYEVDDYGIALTGTETIDLYKPSLKEMNDWGVRYESIRILKVGSFTDSLLHLSLCAPLPYIVAMREDVAKRVREDKARPKTPITSSASPSGEAGGTGTYTGPRPARMPAPIPESAYLRNKPAPLDPSAYNRNKPR